MTIFDNFDILNKFMINLSKFLSEVPDYFVGMSSGDDEKLNKLINLINSSLFPNSNLNANKVLEVLDNFDSLDDESFALFSKAGFNKNIIDNYKIVKLVVELGKIVNEKNLAEIKNKIIDIIDNFEKPAKQNIEKDNNLLFDAALKAVKDDKESEKKLKDYQARVKDIIKIIKKTNIDKKKIKDSKIIDKEGWNKRAKEIGELLNHSFFKTFRLAYNQFVNEIPNNIKVIFKENQNIKKNLKLFFNEKEIGQIKGFNNLLIYLNENINDLINNENKYLINLLNETPKGKKENFVKFKNDLIKLKKSIDNLINRKIIEILKDNLIKELVFSLKQTKKSSQLIFKTINQTDYMIFNKIEQISSIILEEYKQKINQGIENNNFIESLNDLRENDFEYKKPKKGSDEYWRNLIEEFNNLLTEKIEYSKNVAILSKTQDSFKEFVKKFKDIRKKIIQEKKDHIIFKINKNSEEKEIKKLKEEIKEIRELTNYLAGTNIDFLLNFNISTLSNEKLEKKPEVFSAMVYFTRKLKINKKLLEIIYDINKNKLKEDNKNIEKTDKIKEVVNLQNDLLNLIDKNIKEITDLFKDFQKKSDFFKIYSSKKEYFKDKYEEFFNENDFKINDFLKNKGGRYQFMKFIENVENYLSQIYKDILPNLKKANNLNKKSNEIFKKLSYKTE